MTAGRRGRRPGRDRAPPGTSARRGRPSRTRRPRARTPCPATCGTRSRSRRRCWAAAATASTSAAPRVGSGGERSSGEPRQHASVGPVEQLADGALGGGVLVTALRRHQQRSELLRRERDLREVVRVLGDQVALLAAPGVDVDELEGHAEVAQEVLVALEHALGRVDLLLAVGLERLADLFERERGSGLEQQGRRGSAAARAVPSGRRPPSLRHHIGEMPSDLGRPAAREESLLQTPVVLAMDPEAIPLVRAGASRAGGDPTVIVAADPDLPTLLAAVHGVAAEYLVAVCSSPAAAATVARVAMSRRGRPLPVLGIADGVVEAASRALLAEPALEGLNVAVPSLEGDARARLWNSLTGRSHRGAASPRGGRRPSGARRAGRARRRTGPCGRGAVDATRRGGRARGRCRGSARRPTGGERSALASGGALRSTVE